MHLRAKDTVHISAVQSDNLVEGDEFEINDDEGQKLIDRGIAEPADTAPAKRPSPSPAPKPPKAAKQNKGTVQTEKKD